jgi:DNA polymerase III delta subunit
VTEEVVQGLTGSSRTPRFWELTAALEQAQPGVALACLEALLLDGEEPHAVVAWLGGHARGLARALGAAADGLDARRLAAAMKPPRPEFVAARLMTRAAALGPEAVAAALARCFDTERRIKTGGGEPRALLTALVSDLAR